MNVAHYKHGFKYLMVDRDELIVDKSQTGFLYADDVCLIASKMNRTCKGILIVSVDVPLNIV